MTDQPAEKPAEKPAPKQKAAKREKLGDQRARENEERGVEFEVDEEMGTVTTKVGGLGFPDGAENEEGIGPDGRKLDERGNPQ